MVVRGTPPPPSRYDLRPKVLSSNGLGDEVSLGYGGLSGLSLCIQVGYGSKYLPMRVLSVVGVVIPSCVGLRFPGLAWEECFECVG
jgi:hypothetical protein